LNFENLNVLKTLVIDYMIMVIDYNFVNQFEKQCWLLVIDYYLLVIDYQRVKLFGKRFVKTSCATQCFEKLFNTYLD